MEKFHKIVTVELLSSIDHKLRGVQQFIVALRGLVEEDILNDLDEEVKELQNLYEPYLKFRNLNLEEVDFGKFIEDNYNVQAGFSSLVELDKDKLKFIFDSLIEFSDGDYKLSVKSTERGCIVIFCSPSFKELEIKDFEVLSGDIDKLPFFAVGKILGRMGAEFSLKGEEISIEFLHYVE